MAKRSLKPRPKITRKQFFGGFRARLPLRTVTSSSGCLLTRKKMNGANRSKRIFSERHFIDNRAAAAAAAAAMSQRVFLGNNENFVAAVFSSFSSFQATLFSSIQEKNAQHLFWKRSPMSHYQLLFVRLEALLSFAPLAFL